MLHFSANCSALSQSNYNHFFNLINILFVNKLFPLWYSCGKVDNRESCCFVDREELNPFPKWLKVASGALFTFFAPKIPFYRKYLTTFADIF